MMDLSILGFGPTPSVIHNNQPEPKVDRLALSRERLNRLPNSFRVSDVQDKFGLPMSTAWAQIHRWLNWGAIVAGEKYKDERGVYFLTYKKTGKRIATTWNYNSPERRKYQANRKAEALTRYKVLLAQLPETFNTVEASVAWGITRNNAMSTLDNMLEKKLVKKGKKLAHLNYVTTWRKK